MRHTLYFNFRIVFLDIADFLLQETSEINLYLNEKTVNSIKSYKENFGGGKSCGHLLVLKIKHTHSVTYLHEMEEPC